MHVIPSTLAWLFDGVGGAALLALIGFLVNRFRSKEKRTPAGAALTAQGAKVENSPVASGSGITQTINSPTTTVNLSVPAPTVERGCDFWLSFHPSGSRALMIQNSGGEPAFDVVVHIPADGSDFNSDVIHRLPNNHHWVTVGLNGNFVYVEAIRKILAGAVYQATGNGDDVKAIPVLITYRTRNQQSCTFHLEIRLPLRGGILFALPQKSESANSTDELETRLTQARLEEVNAQTKRREAQEQHDERIRLLTAPDSGIRAFAKQKMQQAQARMGANMLIPFTVEELVSGLGAPQSEVEEALEMLKWRGHAKRTSLPGRWVIFDS